MELNEAVRRILGQHWLLILFIFALGVGVAAGLHRDDAKMYTASTRLVLDTPDPASSEESTAIADAAKAIATSPALVRDALIKARAPTRDAVNVARHHVSVRALGTSAVLRLSVSDRSPRVAAATSNALAARLIRTRLNVTQGDIQQVLTGLDERIAKLNRRISSVDAQIDQLNAQAATASARPQANVHGSKRASGPTGADALGSKRDDATRLRDFLAQRRGVLESERVTLLSTDAVRPKASIISPASLPSAPDSSRRLPDMILGGLLGLIFGVGLAALIETIRPTLVGGDALAREFDTPLLGTLSGDPEEPKALQEAGRVAFLLRLFAEVTEVRTVGLLAVDPQVDLRPLAERLDAVPAQPEPALAGALEGPGPGWENVATAGHARTDLHVRPFDARNVSPNNGGAGSMVVVSPTVLKKAELTEYNHLLRITRLPLLGLITYKPSRLKQRRRRRSSSRETEMGM